MAKSKNAGPLTPEVRDVLYRVQEDFLMAAFEVVEHDHGGVEAYLEHNLGVGPVERALLADLYLAS